MGSDLPGTGADQRRDVDRVARPVVAWTVGALSVVVIAVCGWLASWPPAIDAQKSFVVWLNHPPQPLAGLLALSNVLLRPLPLTLVTVTLIAWVLLTARTGSGLRESVRAVALSVVLAEVIAHGLKRVVHQPRPTAVIPGLDVHGYPTDPHGYSYPSAHTSVVVAVVAATWPWLRPSQRVVGVCVAVLIGLNRIYIGAHWPVDVIGGVAIGVLVGDVCWAVAGRWPMSRPAPAASE